MLKNGDADSGERFQCTIKASTSERGVGSQTANLPVAEILFEIQDDRSSYKKRKMYVYVKVVNGAACV